MFNINKRSGELEINLGQESVIPKEVVQFAEVQSVSIENSVVHDVTNLSLLQNLNSVCFSNCKWSDAPKGLSEIINLKSIDFRECAEMVSIDFDSLYNLEELLISDCYKLRELANIEKLVNLKRLMVHYCSKIDFSPLNKLKNLKRFEFWNCGSINFNLLPDLVLNGCCFSAELGDWLSIKPKLDFSSAEISVFVDNDKQFMEVVDDAIINKILYEHFKKIKGNNL